MSGAAAAEEDKDKDHPDNKKLSAEGWSSLREKKRSCTDCLCLLVIIAAWIAMTVVGFIVTGLVKSELLAKGNPVRLTNEIDYDGRICGYDDGVKNRPNGYYLSTGAVVCVEFCPKTTDYYSFYCFDEDQKKADNSYSYGWNAVEEGRCMYEVKTEEYLNRCIWTKDSSNTTSPSGLELVDYGGKAGKSWVSDFFTDMYKLRGYIFGFGIGIALFLSFLYLYFLRIPGVLSLMVWTVILSIFFVLLIGSILLYTLSVKWSNSDTRTGAEVMAMKALSVAGFICTVLYLCLICVLRKRIILAIGIVKEAARAVSAMPVIILMPVFQCIAIVIFLVPWVIYSLYLASSGSIEVHEVESGGVTTTYRTMNYDTNQRYAFLYLLFCWYWTSEFILAIGQIVSALSISAWFFTRDKKSEGNATVLWAVRTTIFNHLGTAAYGSLIIAIIKTIRAIIAYLQRKAKKSGNRLAMFLLSCLQCCMWCLEKCMRFLNKNAYIQTAIYGYSFCKACRAAFFLIARNVLRVFAVSMVGDFVLLLGKICIPLLTTFLCYLALVYSMGNQISGIIGPVLICFILSYFVANLFVEVFGMAISTILVCYCADEEMFPPEERFADGALRGAIKTTQAAHTGQIVPEEKNEKGEVLL